VGLSPQLYDQLPVGLSAGQRQRVNIARALVLEPELLILDETLSALDQADQATLLDLFEMLQARRGITYVYISHDLAMVRRVCARIAVMYLGRIVEIADDLIVLERGRIVEKSPVGTLLATPQHAYSRELIAKVPKLWTTAEVAPKPIETQTVLDVRDVAKTYAVRDRNAVFAHRKVRAVRGVSFTVRRGENFGIICESGCGKSTLSRLLSCL
jgi:peptide/nickel transport system ATP-binding protein